MAYFQFYRSSDIFMTEIEDERCTILSRWIIKRLVKVFLLNNGMKNNFNWIVVLCSHDRHFILIMQCVGEHINL